MNLNIKQRFGVVGIYLALILAIGFHFSNDWKFIVDTNNKLNSVLIATALALILSTYITEPYFSKPVDVITRFVVIFLFWVGLNDNQCLSLYNYWIWTCISFVFIALLLIFLNGIDKIEKYQRLLVEIICKISRPEIVFSALYFDIVISFFRFKSTEYPVLIGFGVLLTANSPVVWIVKWVSDLIDYVTKKSDSSQFLGQVIGHESFDIYYVEIGINSNYRRQTLIGKLVYLENITVGVVGIVLSEKILLAKKWVQILTLKTNDKDNISFDLNSFTIGKSKNNFLQK